MQDSLVSLESPPGPELHVDCPVDWQGRVQLDDPEEDLDVLHQLRVIFLQRVVHKVGLAHVGGALALQRVLERNSGLKLLLLLIMMWFLFSFSCFNADDVAAFAAAAIAAIVFVLGAVAVTLTVAALLM